MYEIGYKALLDGYQFKTRKSDTTRYDVICKNDDCNWKIISKLTNDGTVTHIETDDEDRFKMVFIGVVIRSFKYHMRPLIIIDATHLKCRYEGTNLLAVGMDGNNQIIPIAIGEIPNLTIISDRHAAILSSCEAVFPNAFHGYCCRHLMMNCKLKSIKMQCVFWKMCKAYTVEDFGMAINKLRSKRPDVYEKLIEAGVERWSRAYCPRDRYNYMTSNSAESINSLTRDVRIVSITNLMEWYRKLVQGWYCERREKYKDGPLDELIDDRRRIQTVELCNGTCTCRKWQVSGLPCGHVLAICRVIRLTDCHRLAKGWFMRIALKGTYQELVYPVGEVSSWQIPNYLSIVKSPHLDKQPSGRPKSTKRIRSQGEEPVTVRCERCGRVVTTDKGVGKPFHTQKTYPRGSSQQADDYLPQSMSWSFDAVNLDDP
ncbi:transposase, MuDR, MULE transposase domain protein [Tanacetum coccineum]|uniref:Transposase, MuDR, MULE transposase domain protein n=1 Tax=Tanacetum coccineum TaxID=301880 RepID=A0ABQ5B5W0_9ASTR